MDVKLLNVPWDSYVNNYDRSAKFSGIFFRIFIAKVDKIVYNYFFQEMENFTELRAPSTNFVYKTPLAALWMFCRQNWSWEPLVR